MNAIQLIAAPPPLPPSHPSSTMCACVHPPPYMLGERPTPMHGGSGMPTFRQVPFVRVAERVESGLKVRKQLRKYLKASSSTQHMVAQMHLSDACINAMQPQEIAQSCYENFFAHLQEYNQIVGKKHLEASKAFLEMTRPLESAGKSKKWARDVYNLVQKCVQDVATAERKMEKVRIRKEQAERDLLQWKKVLEANEATYLVQPNNPEVIRAYQLAQTRFTTAFTEDEQARAEYEDCKSQLFTSIERRDQVVEEATELSQSMEEDRLDTMLIVIKQFVETKVAILQSEIEAMVEMQRMLRDMDRESVIQQYIVDSMQPELTHRHANALSLIEWHRIWHQEQTSTKATNDPTTFLVLVAPEDVAKVKNAGLSVNDVDVIKDFLASCFVKPEPLLIPEGKEQVSAKHLSRFTDENIALSMYRIDIVRKIVVHCLHHQRAHDLEVHDQGFEQLVQALRLVLDVCAEKDDTKTAKSIMNMAQTFYRQAPATAKQVPADSTSREYLHAALQDHSIWSVAQYWGNALLFAIGEELSKNPQEMPWYFLSSHDRAQLVLHVHNVVYGQVSSFILHLHSFGFARKQIRQYVQQVCFAFELSEDQRISLLSTVESLRSTDASGKRTSSKRKTANGDDVSFSSNALPDWTSLSGIPQGGQKFRPFVGGSNRLLRTQSTESDTRSVGGDSTVSSSVGGAMTVTSLDDMKSIASASAIMSSSGEEEKWEELFGAAANGDAALWHSPDDESTEGSSKTKKKKKRPHSRREQLRLARSVPLSRRMQNEEDDHFDKPPPEKEKSKAKDKSTKTKTTEIFPSELPTRSYPTKSVDDSALLTSEEMEKRRRSRRMSKARSANVIDTYDIGSVSATSAQYFPTTVGAVASAAMPPSTAHPQEHAKPTTTASSSSSSGMDQILSIAAQMKQRREASTALSSSNKPAFARHSSTMSTMSSSRSLVESMNHEEPMLSGVAALRARFERS